MSPQTTTIVVDQEVAQLLQALQGQARTLGITLGSLLRPLVENGNVPVTEKPFYETATAEEWSKAFLAWADSHDPNIPPLSLEAMSRASIYEDR